MSKHPHITKPTHTQNPHCNRPAQLARLFRSHGT